jgi:hypothetical protein
MKERVVSICYGTYFYLHALTPGRLAVRAPEPAPDKNFTRLSLFFVDTIDRK